MSVTKNKNVINTHVFHYSFSFEIMSVTVQEENIGSLFLNILLIFLYQVQADREKLNLLKN